MALLLVVGVVGALDVGRYFAVEESELPDLVGKTYTEAAATLRGLGLEPVTFVEQVVGVPIDVVTSQSPKAGSTVKQGRTVHLGVNTPPAEVSVPNLIGLQQGAALDRVTELGLPLGVIGFAPSGRPPGEVLAQEPAAGGRLGEAGHVSLTVSSGSERAVVTLPDVKGRTLEDATRELKASGFSLIENRATTISSGSAGAVVGSVPEAGSEVPASTPIVLYLAVANGSVVNVPAVTGLPLAAARRAIENAQLAVGTVTYVDDPSRPAGVLSAKPTGYTARGTPVFLTVNGSQSTATDTGPADGRDVVPDLTNEPREGDIEVFAPEADGSRHIPFTFDPTNLGVKRLMEEPYQLRVLVVDERGERVVLDQALAAGQAISTTVTVYGGDAMLQTYLDDVFFQAWRP